MCYSFTLLKKLPDEHPYSQFPKQTYLDFSLCKIIMSIWMMMMMRVNLSIKKDDES